MHSRAVGRDASWEAKVQEAAFQEPANHNALLGWSQLNGKPLFSRLAHPLIPFGEVIASPSALCKRTDPGNVWMAPLQPG